LGLSDHSRASVQARGLDADRLRQQLEEIQKLRAGGQLPCRLFTGIECDIMTDGSLDLDDDILRELDFVIISIHRSFTLPSDEMTARLVRAMEHPASTMLGHATGRLLLRREGYTFDFDRIFEVARQNEVVIEINAAPERLDLDWRHWRRASAAGVMTAISPDAHDPADFAWVSEGLRSARKAGLTADRVLNTRSADEVATWLAERKKRRWGG
jgi:DNA polymerase (family 10)